MQSTIQIHNCFWSAIHLSIQSIFWIVDGSNPDSTPLQLLDWSAEWSEALHFLSSIQISLHSQFKTGHVDEMTKTQFCLCLFPEMGMKLPHSAQGLQRTECTPLECHIALHLSFHSALLSLECNLNPHSKNARSFGVTHSMECQSKCPVVVQSPQQTDLTPC